MQKKILFKASSLKRLIVSLILSFIFLGLILIKPQSTFAAYGGRIGGGNFNTPSAPTRGNNYGQNYGGYGGSYRRGGIGFPFLLPIFGFGGGGLFGFLILITISGVIANAFRNTNNSVSNTESIRYKDLSPQSATMIQMQLGLLSGAKEVQKDLKELALLSDTTTSKGLQKILQETTLSLLRKQEFWIYANLEIGNVPFHSADSTFNRLSITERSKLKGESTSNFEGKISSIHSKVNTSTDLNSDGEFIVVTILIASKSNLSISDSLNNECLQENMRVLGSISSNELLALEVIWQPEDEDGSLSEEELVITYPNLKHL